MRAFGLLLLLCSCATIQRPAIEHLPASEVWSDAQITREALYCAIAQIDGLDIADRIANADVTASHGLRQRTGMTSTFFPPGNIGLDSDDDSAWHSGWRYEALCRLRLYLIDGKLGTCTADRWNDEIKPRYTPTLSVCYREAEERREQ